MWLNRWVLLPLLLTIAATVPFASVARCEVMFDWVTVGDPGFGGVDYSYRISKYEVTNTQYAAFLNAVQQFSTLGLYRTEMGVHGGIARNGGGTIDDPFLYVVKPESANLPVNYVNFVSVMNFVNWLENGQPVVSAPITSPDQFVTGTGTYAIIGTNEERNPGATYFVPNDAEWYKAGHYDPVLDKFNVFATSSDERPHSVPPVGPDGPAPANSANAWGEDGCAFPKPDGLCNQNEVGAYALSPSPYGTFDQSGNVSEWVEGEISRRRHRGGHIGSGRGTDFFPPLIDRLPNSGAVISDSGYYDSRVGFRIAAIVPEPESSSILFLSLVTATVISRRRRKPAISPQ